MDKFSNDFLQRILGRWKFLSGSEFERLWNFLTWVAGRWLGFGHNAVEDAAGNVIARLTDPGVRASVINSGNSVSFLWRMATFAAITEERKGRRRADKHRIVTLDENVSSEIVAPADDSHNQTIAKDELAKFWHRLTDDERNLLRMIFWEGRTIPQIAKQHNLPRVTVYQRWFRLKNKVRAWLDGPGPC